MQVHRVWSGVRRDTEQTNREKVISLLFFCCITMRQQNKRAIFFLDQKYLLYRVKHIRTYHVLDVTPIIRSRAYPKTKLRPKTKLAWRMLYSPWSDCELIKFVVCVRVSIVRTMKVKTVIWFLNNPPYLGDLHQKMMFVDNYLFAPISTRFHLLP